MSTERADTPGHCLCAVCGEVRIGEKDDQGRIKYPLGCYEYHTELIEKAKMGDRDYCILCKGNIHFERVYFPDHDGICVGCIGRLSGLPQAVTRENINLARAFYKKKLDAVLHCGWGGACDAEQVESIHHVLCAICFKPRSRHGVYLHPGCCADHTRKITQMKKTHARCADCRGLIHFEQKGGDRCLHCLHVKNETKCKGCGWLKRPTIQEYSEEMQK